MDHKQWAVKERSWCVKRYHECKSYVTIQAEFVHVFQTANFPDKKRIEAWVKKFHEYGTVQNL